MLRSRVKQKLEMNQITVDDAIKGVIDGDG
jgi:hypothetical protein